MKYSSEQKEDPRKICKNHAMGLVYKLNEKMFLFMLST